MAEVVAALDVMVKLGRLVAVGVCARPASTPSRWSSAACYRATPAAFRNYRGWAADDPADGSLEMAGACG